MNIAVFCGSATGNNPAYTQAAELLGEWIAARGDSLVYGGGDAGLMGVVAKKVFESGNTVIGVVPGNIAEIADRPQIYVTRLITAENMSARKQAMLDLADMFVALPGGIGTMDEMTEAITLNRLGTFHKPCVFFNADNYYEPFRQMLDRMIESDFIEPEVYSYVKFRSPEDMVPNVSE